MIKKVKLLCLFVCLCFALQSCALVELAGKVYVAVGEALLGWNKGQENKAAKAEQTPPQTTPQTTPQTAPQTAPKEEPPTKSVEETPSPVVMDIAEAQKILNDKGYNPGPIDGKMGAKTQDAIRSFQQDQGLNSTGTLNEATISRLRK